MRVPNDTVLLESDIGVDLILGGHDHHYEVKEVYMHHHVIVKIKSLKKHYSLTKGVWGEH